MTEQDRVAPDYEADPNAAAPSTDLVPSKGQGSPGMEPPLRQLDSIIDNLASYATPVLREIAARAAELAARAGEAAGPIAKRAADKTEEVAGRVATKSREVASDLRSDASAPSSESMTPPIQPAEQTSAEQEAGLPPR